MLGTKQQLQPLQTLQQPQVRTCARLPALAPHRHLPRGEGSSQPHRPLGLCRYPAGATNPKSNPKAVLGKLVSLFAASSEWLQSLLSDFACVIFERFGFWPAVSEFLLCLSRSLSCFCLKPFKSSLSARATPHCVMFPAKA